MPRLFYARIIAPAYDRPRPLRSSTRPFNPFHRRGERRMEGPGRSFLASLSVYFASPISILVALSFLSPFSDMPFLVSFMSQTRKRSVDAPRNDWRPFKKCTRTFRQPPTSLSPRCSRISPGKVFQTLKMHDIPTALWGEAHRIDIHAHIAYRACSIRMCVYVTSLLYSVGERWEFHYERRAEKSNKKQRWSSLVAIFF